MILSIDGIQSMKTFINAVQDGAQISEDELPATFALARTIFTWTIVLAIDFIISFSYTLFPRKAPEFSRR